ncbi:ABC transporter substrate-binding protein [Candidatus Poribacteria bacterium]|nr:ABC transporter substrate-binding protein [Candidatus Poribacteria bacterium]
MNIFRNSIFMLALVIPVVFVFVSGCERVTHVLDSSSTSTEDSEEYISIGVVIPQSGRLQPAFGVHIENALKLARDEINESLLAGLQLKFIIEDSNSTPEGAVEAYNKLITEYNVNVVIGPATSSASKQTFPIAQDKQVVAISPTSAARGLSAISDYAFRIALTTEVLVPEGIATTHPKLNYQEVATLYDEADVFSTDADTALQEEFKTKDIVVLITETFRSGDNDFTEQLTRIQALNPDAIFVSSLPPEKPGILQKAHELGISVPIIIRTLTDADVEVTGDAAEGAITFVGWGSALETPNNQDFINTYKSTYGIKPNNYAARSYATLYILAKAIANAESTDADDIRDALTNIKDFDTILGKFSFDENGDAIYDTKVLIVKDGKLVLFE